MAYRTNTSNVPCKYFQQGNCKWGNSCKYAHVYANSDGSNQAQGSSMSETDLYKSFISPTSMAKIQKVILSDLQESEIFQKSPLASAYSYGVPCGINLINDRDLSPEELRFKYYEARQKGTLSQYEAEVLAREKDMKKCLQHIRDHPDWAARYLQKGTKELRETGHTTLKSGFINFPIDFTGQAGFGASGSSSFGINPFTQGQNAFGSTGAFGAGATAAFGQGQAQGSEGAFGFGAAKANTTNVFGGTNVAAQQSGGAFGKPSFSGFSMNSAAGSAPPNTSNVFGTAAPAQSAGTGSVFGQTQFGARPAAGSSTGAFGKPSFGSSSFGQTAFGSPALGGTGTGSLTASPFSSLQNTGATQSRFASLQNKPADASTASPFGSLQTNQPPTPSPFGGLPVSDNPTMAASAGAFGKMGTSMPSPFANLSATDAANAQGTTQFGFNKPGAAFGTENTGAGNTTGPFGLAKGAQANVFGSGFTSGSKASADASGGARARKFVQGIPTEDSQVSPNDLDKQTLEQFEAASFILGKVPDIPPPMALIS
ncbi:hypothetical protein HG536_0C00570 [Torulaspora globosa]|uniref:C3H1-type domain-containing protein n=1 Tax=Torulaspora globosa TaxID=48254 RepID=A0A7G3ZEF4_9SACH|nr:uncharacterized protein HG536_0C00570 [Torulaspora globosa]QLL31890.1 hypothetical protein HG536_0C00570 [Torulaspora globosa]